MKLYNFILHILKFFKAPGNNHMDHTSGSYDKPFVLTMADTIIPSVQSMLEKELRYLEFLVKNDAPKTMINNSKLHISYYQNKLNDYNNYIASMKVVNKTPHKVVIVDENNNIVKIYNPDTTTIRLAVKTVPGEPLPDGTPTSTTQFGQAEGLPEYHPEIYYIVSQLVKNALPDRKDLLVPAEVVRDQDGNIIGCKSLGR